MNNDYYKSIVGQDRWFIDDNTCHRVGDAFGRKPKTRWYAHARASTKNGGPFFWIKENLVCPNKARPDRLNDHDRACLEEAPEGMTCKPDPPVSQLGAGPREPNEDDGDVNRGCEKYRFIIGRD